MTNTSKMCPRCAADPHPRAFAGPRECAFPAGTFEPANWQCVSMAIARGHKDDGESVANGHDQRVIVIILPSGAFAVLGVYKNRGRTEAAVVIDGIKARPLTLADIDDLAKRGPQCPC